MSAGRQPPPIIAHVPVIPGAEADSARRIARSAISVFAQNAQYAAVYAAAGMPVGPDGHVSDELIDAVVLSGDETAVTDQLGERASGRYELVVTLESPGSAREQDTLFRVLGTLSRALTH